MPKDLNGKIINPYKLSQVNIEDMQIPDYDYLKN